MGILNTVKGWLNIGGVSVKLQGVSQRVSRSGNLIDGTVLLKSKGDKQVLSLKYQFVMRLTRKKVGSQNANDKETTEHVIAETIHDEPFEMKEGETKTVPFVINYRMEQRVQDRGGFLGAMGKLGSLVSSDEEEYCVRAMCDVKGTVLDPGDNLPVVLVD